MSPASQLTRRIQRSNRTSAIVSAEAFEFQPGSSVGRGTADSNSTQQREELSSAQ